MAAIASAIAVGSPARPAVDVAVIGAAPAHDDDLRDHAVVETRGRAFAPSNISSARVCGDPKNKSAAVTPAALNRPDNFIVSSLPRTDVSRMMAQSAGKSKSDAGSGIHASWRIRRIRGTTMGNQGKAIASRPSSQDVANLDDGPGARMS